MMFKAVKMVLTYHLQVHSTKLSDQAPWLAVILINTIIVYCFIAYPFVLAQVFPSV